MLGRLVAAIATSMVVVTLAACGDDEPSCGAPDHVTYTCQPTDAPGCQGGPYWPGAKDHADTVYPAGCFAEMPECSGIFKGRPVMEQCMDLGSGLEWGTTG